MFVDLEALRANGGDELDYRVYVSGDRTRDQAAAGLRIGQVLDKEAVLDVVSTEIDTMLGMFYALLMLAIVIALLGIANTLALSILERTRELGLPGQSACSAAGAVAVRWESTIIAVFGTTLGLGVGVLFGWAACAPWPTRASTPWPCLRAAWPPSRSSPPSPVRSPPSCPPDGQPSSRCSTRSSPSDPSRRSRTISVAQHSRHRDRREQAVAPRHGGGVEGGERVDLDPSPS